MSAPPDTYEPAPGESSGVIRVPRLAAGEDPAALSGADYPILGEEPINVEDGALIGRELGNYRLLRLLGGTGMSRVYQAEQATGDKLFAVKVLRNENFNPSGLDVVVRRFLQEARLASRLDHPHIVDVVDFGVADELAYLVMEYLDGESLRETLRRHGPLPWTRVLPMFLHICDALEMAHAKGVIHRDLKPSNCFRIRHATGDDFIKVCDFGLARIVDEDAPDGLLANGVLLATPEYMAPELIRGAKPDPRVDIYGIGVLLYELLTGTCPFQSGKQTTVLAMQLLDTAIPPRRVAPDANIPSSVERVIMRALSKQPEDRFPTIADMRAALLDDTRAHKIVPAEISRSARVSKSTQSARSLTSASIPDGQGGGRGMTIALAVVATALVAWVLLGTPGIDGADNPAPNPPTTQPPNALAQQGPSPHDPSAPVPTLSAAAVDGPVADVAAGSSGAHPEDGPPNTNTPDDALTPVPADPKSRPASGVIRQPELAPGEQVNYEIVDDIDLPAEVSDADIDELLRPYRPAASACGKQHGMAIGSEIAVKLLLTNDGHLTGSTLEGRSNPAPEAAVRCVIDLLKTVRLSRPDQQKFTGAVFNYGFRVY